MRNVIECRDDIKIQETEECKMMEKRGVGIKKR